MKFWVYAAIVGVTAYYSLFGRALDLYDSILWLLAFLFIEINVTEWNEEARDEAAARNRDRDRDRETMPRSAGD